MRQGCICKNSRCLKSYCKCFQSGKKCNPFYCKCESCENIDKVQQNNQFKQANQVQNNIKRPEQTTKTQQKPINPAQNSKNKVKNQLNKGQVVTCSCKKSHCLKKYCACFSSGKECGDYCECNDCRNRYEDDEDREEKEEARQRFGRVDLEEERE